VNKKFMEKYLLQGVVEGPAVIIIYSWEERVDG
jgi:hypothetical protein